MSNPYDKALASLAIMDEQATAAHAELTRRIQEMIDLIDNWKNSNAIENGR